MFGHFLNSLPMDSLERARKIGQIATDPRTLKLHSQHEELVNRMVSAMGKAKDTFIKRFLLRHFPYALQDRIEKFGNAAPEDVAGAVAGLLEACSIACLEYPAEREKGQARVTAFKRADVELCRLEMFMDSGELHANEFVAPPKDLVVFGYDVPAVRIFFWRLCQSQHEPLANISRKHYAIRFGCNPEPTLDAINFESVGFSEFSVQDSGTGEQQRAEPDRG